MVSIFYIHLSAFLHLPLIYWDVMGFSLLCFSENAPEPMEKHFPKHMIMMQNYKKISLDTNPYIQKKIILQEVLDLIEERLKMRKLVAEMLTQASRLTKGEWEGEILKNNFH